MAAKQPSKPSHLMSAAEVRPYLEARHGPPGAMPDPQVIATWMALTETDRQRYLASTPTPTKETDVCR